MRFAELPAAIREQYVTESQKMIVKILSRPTRGGVSYTIYFRNRVKHTWRNREGKWRMEYKFT